MSELWIDQQIQRNLAPRAERINSEIRGYTPEAPKKEVDPFGKQDLNLSEVAGMCLLLRKHGPRTYRRTWEVR